MRESRAWTQAHLADASGVSHGDLDERRFEIMADNCRAFASGQPLRNQVDKASWF